MANPRLTDSQAKDILRHWPRRTKRLWPTKDGTGYWLRALPTEHSAPCSTIRSPGVEQYTTQPDGLYLYLYKNEYADAVAIESCGTIQNLNDKRSRYMPATHSIVVVCPLAWLNGQISVQRGGMSSRWKASNSILVQPQADLTFPVRHLRVLYALPNARFEEWTPHHVPTGYEYFCKHSSLDTYNSAAMQQFLKQMSLYSHFTGTGRQIVKGRGRIAKRWWPMATRSANHEIEKARRR